MYNQIKKTWYTGFLFLTVLFVCPLNELKSQILTPTYPAAAQTLTMGYGTGTLTVQIGFTSTCNNDTVTILLPQSVTYVPGSVSKISGSQTIAEGNITNLRTPKFVISNVSGTGDITFTIQRRASCGNLASGKDSVIVKGSCGTAQEISGIVNTYNIYSPSLSLSPPSSIVDAVIRRIYDRTITITNGGNGDADTLYFYVVYPSQGIVNRTGTNTLTANGVNFVPWKTNGDTLFYKFFGATIFGGNNLLSNGETITITEPIKIAKCNTNTSYAVGWGISNKKVCSYATGNASVSMATAVPNFTAINMTNTGYTDKCTSYDVNVTLTNGGTGNDTAAAMFDVKLYWGYCYPSSPTVWSGFNTAMMTISNGRINGNTISSFTISGSMAQMDLNNLFTTDPDGAGGLEDLDGDGFYDDLRRGNSVTYTITLTNKCSYNCNTDRQHYPGASIEYRSMCAGSKILSACRYFNHISEEHESSFSTTGYVPANIQGGVPFRVNLKFGRYENYSGYSNANSRYRYFLKLPAGVSVSGTGNPRYGFTSVSYVQSNDTVFIQSGSNIEDSASITLVFTCGSSGTKTFNYGVQKIQNIITGCFCRSDMACGSMHALAICPGPCPAGPTTYIPVVRRTDGSLGWTNSTMSVRQSASAISAYDLSKALYLDTIQITGSAIQNSSVTNLHVELTLGRTGTTNKLAPLDIAARIYRSGSMVAAYTISSYTDNSSGGNQVTDWDLSSGLPSGTMLPGDSVITVSRYVVADNVTLPQQDIQSGGTWNYYSIISATREGCNNPVPEMYLVGTHLVDGRNGWAAAGCNAVSDNRSHLARRFNTSGVLFLNEYRPSFFIDSIVVTYPPTYTIGAANATTFATGTLTPSAIRGRTYVYSNPGNWQPVPLTVTNTYGAFLTYTMLPSCKSATNQVHNVKFYIRDYYYVLSTKSVYPTAYKYILGNNSNNIASTPAGISQTIVYTSAQKPVLGAQNLTGTVTGIQKQHYWDIQLNNTGLSAAPYVWLSIDKPAGGGIAVDSVVSLTANTQLTANGYGVSGNWYRVSQAGIAVAGVHNLRVYFKYSNCAADSLLLRSGWNCSGWPSPDPASDTNVCSQTSTYVKVVPANSEVQLSVARQPGNGGTISLCTKDSIIVQVNSAQAANLISPRVEVYAPTGVTISSSAMVEYPLGSGNWQSVTGTAISGGLNVNLNSHTGIGSNGLPGTILNPGASGRQAALKLYYNTDCSITSGSSFTFKTYGNKPCGQAATGNGVVTKSNGVNITDATVSGGVGVTITLSNDTFRCGTPTRTLSLSSTPVTTPTQIGDTVIYTLPEGLSYAGNFVAGTNCVTCAASSSPGTLPNTTLVKIKLHPGISSGTALQYSFDAQVDMTKGCGNTQISAEARRNIPPLMCGLTACANSSVVVGSQDKPIVIMKPDLQITTLNAAYANAGTWYTYQYQVFFSNNGNDSLKTSSGYKLELYFDADGNGILNTSTDKLVVTRVLSAPLAVGASTSLSGTFTDNQLPSATRQLWAVFSTATSPNCNCSAMSVSTPVVGLPVTIANYSIKTTGCVNTLEWMAAAQENHFFSIETAEENLWKPIAKIVVPLTGSSNQLKAYKYVHTASAGKNIYRITDVNTATGARESMDPLIAYNRCGSNITVKPNPASETVTFKAEGRGICSIYNVFITTVDGKTLIKETFTNNSGEITITQLTPGIYMLRVTCDVFSETVKLIVK